VPEFSPIQPAFNAGEWSPRAHGRVDAPGYKRALSLCENFIPTPQGSLLMRAGTKRAGEVGDGRLIPFLSSEGERYMLVLKDAKLSVYTEAGVLAEIAPNIILNGRFDADLSHWTVGGYYCEVRSGVCAMIDDAAGGVGGEYIKQVPATVIGGNYRLTFDAWSDDATAGLYVRVTSIPGGDLVSVYPALTRERQRFTYNFTANNGAEDVIFNRTGPQSPPGVEFPFTYVDDVVLIRTDGTTVTELAAPWAVAHLADIQYDGEPAQNRVVFVHPNMQPQVLVFSAPATWELYAAPFASKPGSWAGTNWPRAVEMGFQGRSWFAGTPVSPHTVWYSKSGDPFNFDTGTAQPDESSLFVVSTKGAIHWLRGQKNLLAGSSVLEHSASGSNRIIIPGDVDVQDQSAFGSAAVQAQHIGDEVIFVGRDRRTIRALSYDWGTKNGWVTQALSFIAEHMMKGKQVKELHFTYNPDPLLFVLFTDGTLVGSVHDRGAQIEAWFRAPIGNVRSCGMLDGDDGGVLWAIVERSGEYILEMLPLHDVGVQYLDSWVTGVISTPDPDSDPSHFHTPYPVGTAVRVFVDGLLEPGEYVTEAGHSTGSLILLPSEYGGSTAVVGLAYRARATTLPLEGGNPGGTMQGKESHYSVLMVRLNDSAPVLLGKAGGDLERVGDGRPFSTLLDAAEALLTGDYSVGNVSLGASAKVSIEQDLPFRTEVCALFGDVQFADL